MGETANFELNKNELTINNYSPLKNNVLIEIVEKKEDKIGNIFIPDIANTREATGETFLIRGIIHKFGSKCKSDIKIGSEVYFNALRSNAVSEQENLVVCDYDDIFAVISEGKNQVF